MARSRRHLRVVDDDSAIGVGVTRRRTPLGAPARFIIRLDLKDSHPLIWRRLAIRSDVTLDAVHRVIQAAFGWYDGHLYRFALGGAPFDPAAEAFVCALDVDEGDPATPLDEVRLDETLQESGDVLHYVYDYGDHWDLAVTLERIVELDDDVTARCLGGERAAPPEDCGGVRDAVGLAELLDDPAAFDIDAVNAALIDPFAALADSGVRREVIDLLTDTRGTPWGDDLVVRTLAAMEPMDIDEAERAACLAPITWLLNRIGPEGMALTSAGYLKPEIVRELWGILPSNIDWPVGSREINAGPMVFWRKALAAVGLIRTLKGQLVLTKVGIAACQDIDVLWAHLAERLLISDRDDFTRTVRLLSMICAASSSEDPHGDAAHLLTQLGWRSPSGGLDVYTVLDVDRDAHTILENVATEAVTWSGNRRLSPAAIALARAALQA